MSPGQIKGAIRVVGTPGAVDHGMERPPESVPSPSPSHRNYVALAGNSIQFCAPHSAGRPSNATTPSIFGDSLCRAIYKPGAAHSSPVTRRFEIYHETATAHQEFP